MVRFLLGSFAATILTIGLPLPVAALQRETFRRESDDVRIREECRLAAKTLETGHPAPHSEWALDVIQRCDESAGPALQQRWAAPPADSASLEQLYRASAAVRDGRIYAAVAIAARAHTAAALVRITALRVLKAYIDPNAVTDLDLLRPRPAGTGLISATQYHAVQLDGSVPLPSDLRSAVLTLLREVASNDPDAGVRYAAWYLGGRPAGG